MTEETKNPEAVEETTEETTAEATEATTEAAPAAEETAPEAATTDDAAASEADDAGEEVEVPEKFQKLVEQVEEMTVLELNELVKVLEKRFGVSAAAVAVAGPAAGGDAGGGEEEQSEFAVELTDVGGQKIAVIKAVKEALGLGLKEAKEMVDGAPAVLKEGMKKEDAETLKGTLEEAGATVTLK